MFTGLRRVLSGQLGTHVDSRDGTGHFKTRRQIYLAQRVPHAFFWYICQQEQQERHEKHWTAKRGETEQK